MSTLHAYCSCVSSFPLLVSRLGIPLFCNAANFYLKVFISACISWHFLSKVCTKHSKMATPVALNITPLNAPHKELEALPLADRDYLIQDLVGDRNHLQTFCQLRNSFLNKSDMYGIWESNLPIYFLPSVNIFLEIIHLCAKNYEPSQRAVKSPSGSILFHITPDSINQMLNFKQT